MFLLFSFTIQRNVFLKHSAYLISAGCREPRVLGGTPGGGAVLQGGAVPWDSGEPGPLE